MIYLANDHNGVERMKFVKKWLTENGYEWESVGADTFIKTDSYVDYVKKANQKILEDKNNRGIYLCGTGIGVQMAGNRTKGIRAFFCNNKQTAYFARLHEDANVICFGVGYKGYPKFSNKKLVECLKMFFNTQFEGDRHIDRIKSLDEI